MTVLRICSACHRQELSIVGQRAPAPKLCGISDEGSEGRGWGRGCGAVGDGINKACEEATEIDKFEWSIISCLSILQTRI